MAIGSVRATEQCIEPSPPEGLAWHNRPHALTSTTFHSSYHHVTPSLSVVSKEDYPSYHLKFGIEIRTFISDQWNKTRYRSYHVMALRAILLILGS